MPVPRQDHQRRGNRGQKPRRQIRPVRQPDRQRRRHRHQGGPQAAGAFPCAEKAQQRHRRRQQPRGFRRHQGQSPRNPGNLERKSPQNVLQRLRAASGRQPEQETGGQRRSADGRGFPAVRRRLQSRGQQGGNQRAASRGNFHIQRAQQRHQQSRRQKKCQRQRNQVAFNPILRHAGTSFSFLHVLILSCPAARRIPASRPAAAGKSGAARCCPPARR